MTTKSIVGLFERNADQLENHLINAGLHKDQFLKEKTDGEVFLFSVRVDNEQELETAKNVFTKLAPHNTYEFPFVAENESRIRSYVEAAAKTKIQETPAIKSTGNLNDGLNSEMVIGDQT